MNYAVIGAMAFQNTSRRDNAHGFIVTRLAAEVMYSTVTVTDGTYLSQPALFCNFRFTQRAARDLFWTDLIASLTGVSGPVAGSWAAKHDCDDQVATPCVESLKQEW